MDATDSSPLDTDLVSASPETFEWQMRYVREQLNPISLSELARHFAQPTHNAKHAVVVTFDDGFADTYEHAFPVLQRYAIPATVFVTTSHVDTGEPFWFEMVAALMAHAPPRSIELDGFRSALPTGDSLPARREDLRALQQRLRSLQHHERKRLLEHCAREVRARSLLSSGVIGQPLNWEQVEHMARAGIEFGSHTVTHPNLALLSEQELRWELRESKRVLEARLQQAVHAIAYPFGTADAYDRRVLDEARAAGFSIGVSYSSGVNWLGSSELLDLRRRGVSLDTSPAYFHAMTSLPDWA